ncbi:MAG: hypothetical protein HOG33_04720 [Candidatus Marinimicrobia bacterium]|jgi:hypothetical protein|nr:hypothetical protein [Candidatus Neomarinimicrobiota bacterium]MBT3796102.1 hypothetical protein [Candidatus Neomarinimicrobiota bacterium]MBT4150031.1 hypothetical protein [Candidatus Neomarinimicrobiota bacterium]MBT4784359.1 hypothetical protein [Candidatus Neomarinimicrobiota bacterium]MBT5097208.1 hypothetical protein [Candidatus Neomarinimicrobiota bacterium]
MNKPLSKQLGELFAQFQDLIDTASHTVIKRLNEDDKKRNRLLSFFSTIGDSYYKKYSEIKKDSKSS